MWGACAASKEKTMPMDFGPEIWPRLPYAVIDQNCLRDTAVVTAAIKGARNGRLVLLHYIAIVEMTKSNEWADTLAHSLKILAQYPQGVVAGHATGVLMRREMASGDSHFDIVDHEWTPPLRRCLQDIATGSGPVLDALKKTVPPAKKDADDQQLNTAVNKKMLLTAVEVWKEELSKDELRQLRNDDDALFRRLLAERRMTVTIASGLQNAGYEADTARALACVPSVSAHNWLCMAANALDWVIRSGIESLPDEKFNNELCDLDYLVAASFCEELITKEKKMRRLHDHLRHVVDLRWTEIRALFEAARAKSAVTNAGDSPE